MIYDYLNKSQRLLQGHCNKIKATACSDNKKWIVTADSGEDSMLVAWDSESATPVRTFLKPHENGVKCMDLSSDCQYIVTIGAEDELKQMQTISLWDWTEKSAEGPIISMQCKNEMVENLKWIKFNPENNHEIAVNGDQRVAFLNWEHNGNKNADGKMEPNKFEYYACRIEKKDLKNQQETKLTKTVFLPGTMAVTGTNKGDIIVWDESLIIEGVGEQHEKRLIKVVTLNQDPTHDLASIDQLMTVRVATQTYLVVGNADGTVRFYDDQFKAEAWFEEHNLSRIKSISFSNKEARPATLQEKENGGSKFKCPDFIVADESALVLQLESKIFEAIDSEDKKAKTIMHGLQSQIIAVACHPHKPILAIAGNTGFVKLWNYKTKEYLGHGYEDYSKESRDKAKDSKKSLQYTCIEFTPDGKELLVANTEGHIIILDPETAEQRTQPNHNPISIMLDSSEIKEAIRIEQLVISEDG